MRWGVRRCGDVAAQENCRVLCTADIPDIQRMRTVRDALARDETPFYECDLGNRYVPALREMLE